MRISCVLKYNKFVFKCKSTLSLFKTAPRLTKLKWYIGRSIKYTSIQINNIIGSVCNFKMHTFMR